MPGTELPVLTPAKVQCLLPEREYTLEQEKLILRGHQVFGARLKAEIKNRGFRVGWLSEYLGWSRTSLSTYVGANSTMKLREVFLLADVLEINPGSLLPSLKEMRGDSPLFKDEVKVSKALKPKPQKAAEQPKLEVEVPEDSEVSNLLDRLAKQVVLDTLNGKPALKAELQKRIDKEILKAVMGG